MGTWVSELDHGAMADISLVWWITGLCSCHVTRDRSSCSLLKTLHFMSPDLDKNWTMLKYKVWRKAFTWYTVLKQTLQQCYALSLACCKKCIFKLCLTLDISIRKSVICFVWKTYFMRKKSAVEYKLLVNDVYDVEYEQKKCERKYHPRKDNHTYCILQHKYCSVHVS